MVLVLFSLMVAAVPAWLWEDGLERTQIAVSCRAVVTDNDCSRSRLKTYFLTKQVWMDEKTSPDQRVAIDIAVARNRMGTNIDWTAAFEAWAGTGASTSATVETLQQSFTAPASPLIPGTKSSPEDFDVSLASLCRDNDACPLIQRKARLAVLSAYASSAPDRQKRIKEAIDKNTYGGFINWQTAAYAARVDFMNLPTYAPPPPPYVPSITTRCQTYVSKSGRYASTTCNTH